MAAAQSHGGCRTNHSELRFINVLWDATMRARLPRERLISEIADLGFHVSVLMADEGIDWAAIESELERRK